MPSRKKDFKRDDVIKMLLWCARHCCLCGKQCGAAIEIAHIDPNGPAALDNAIPLCFDCHQQIGSYNPKHPKGRRYGPEELRTRREQIFERYTSHLVPALLYRLVQGRRRQLPDVGFHIQHVGGPYPIRARVVVRLAQGNRNCSAPAGHYGGQYLWNLNPGFGVDGHFTLPKQIMIGLGEPPVRAQIDMTVIDIYEREHELLPLGYIHRLEQGGDWYLEPSEEELAM